jgi:hypothetical protein
MQNGRWTGKVGREIDKKQGNGSANGITMKDRQRNIITYCG